MSKNRIILVIPAYNEEESILKTYKCVENYNKTAKEKLDVIVINDGSKDKTKEILEKNNIPHINLINNLGIGGAVQTGYKYALENGYDIAIQYDGDGQHDVNYVKDIVKPIENNEVSMVIGSRFVEKDKEGFKSSKARRIGINIISFFIKVKTKKKIYDVTSGFRAIDRSLMELFKNYYPVEYPEPISTVNALKNNFKVSEVPVVMKEREQGKSSISSWKNVYYMINVILSIILMKGKN
ncbi:MAG: glycosyltransferase family 2 protein [Bacilli bacterium]|nr:glycosyltransferase family 2 protein [Bacilli bacterium]